MDRRTNGVPAVLHQAVSPGAPTSSVNGGPCNQRGTKRGRNGPLPVPSHSEDRNKFNGLTERKPRTGGEHQQHWRVGKASKKAMNPTERSTPVRHPGPALHRPVPLRVDTVRHSFRRLPASLLSPCRDLEYWTVALASQRADRRRISPSPSPSSNRLSRFKLMNGRPSDPLDGFPRLWSPAYAALHAPSGWIATFRFVEKALPRRNGRLRGSCTPSSRGLQPCSGPETWDKPSACSQPSRRSASQA